MGCDTVREKAAGPGNAGRSVGRVALPSAHWSRFAMRLDATLHNDFDECPRDVPCRDTASMHVILTGGDEPG